MFLKIVLKNLIFEIFHTFFSVSEFACFIDMNMYCPFIKKKKLHKDVRLQLWGLSGLSSKINVRPEGGQYCPPRICLILTQLELF